MRLRWIFFLGVLAWTLFMAGLVLVVTGGDTLCGVPAYFPGIPGAPEPCQQLFDAIRVQRALFLVVWACGLVIAVLWTRRRPAQT
jgi:hypothetical protein